MTKYYTMKECFDACGDDDMPYCENEFGLWNASYLTKKQLVLENFPPKYEFSLSDKWQIKRATPVVLSTSEWCDLNSTKALTIGECFEAGDKNGQLREYYRPEQVELREAAMEYKEQASGESLSRLFEALDNLKPPKAD